MPNTLTEVIPQLLAQGMLALREEAFMPLIVNRKYEDMAGQKGSSIDIPIPSAIAAQEVAPAATPPATAGVSPTSVSIALDQWYEAPFYLTDKELGEVMAGTIPMQASEAIRSLANTINSSIFGVYTGIYGYAGTAALTPFGTSAGTTDATNMRKTLKKQLSPMAPLYGVLDPDAEGNALNLRAFQDTSWANNGSVIMDGQLQTKLGFNWASHQLVPTHTCGTAISGGKTITVTDANAVGDDAVTMDVDSGTGTLVVGDVFTFANHTQTYVVTANKTLTTGGVEVSISPTLQAAVDGSGTPVAVTGKASHVVNLGFHRDAIAFVTRPLEADSNGLAYVESVVDPESKLTLRLEVTREHKRTRYSFDILWGVKLVRPEFACRLAG